MGLPNLSVYVFGQSLPSIINLFYVVTLAGVYLVLLNIVGQTRGAKNRKKFYKNMVFDYLVRTPFLFTSMQAHNLSYLFHQTVHQITEQIKTTSTAKYIPCQSKPMICPVKSCTYLTSLSHLFINMTATDVFIFLNNRRSISCSIPNLIVSTWLWLCIWYITAKTNDTP